MNAKLGKRIIEISRALKPQKETGKAFHTCFAIKKGKIEKIGINNYQKSHNYKRFGRYDNWKKFPTEYRPSVHAECAMLIRLGKEDLSDYQVAVVRIDNNNMPKLSRPCLNCSRLLSAVSPKSIFYTNNDGEFEQMAM